MPLEQKQPRPRKNTRNEIIEAATILYSENGVSAVSIRDITRKVGINESSLYNHFKCKDELMDVLIELIQRELGEASFPSEKIEELMAGMEPTIFFQHHLLRLREKITPTIQMIWKILYTEQFRDKRARDFIVREIIGRPFTYYEMAFRLMREKGMIAQTANPTLLADELNYGLLALSLERMLLQTDQKDTTKTIRKMFEHLKFVCESVTI